ncbi:MAG: glycosyltransferase [Bacteroidota bacterium]
MIQVLYISYDGMTDQLGQSQVIPYLKGLSKKGYQFTLLSFEKPERFKKYAVEISSLLKENNIEWVPLTYIKKPPVLSTMWDVHRMKRRAFQLHREKKFEIVHCRSYLSSLVGLQMKQKFQTKFIFDMRAFYADERVDGRIWNLDNPFYKFIYRFFKTKEKEFLKEADYVITLTQRARDIIHTWKEIPAQPIPIQVIPCCSDLELFSERSVDQQALQMLRHRFQLTGNEFVLTYLGSVGTWYMLNEMLDFFKCLLTILPQAKFLFITNDLPADILKKAEAMGISKDAFIISPAERKNVPTYLALSRWSIFFIQPYFSKTGSSPTKQGEIMGMGIPIVCNAGVGDVDSIVADTHSGYVLKDFSESTYKAAIEKMQKEELSKEQIREGAFKYYALEKGVGKYEEVYRRVLGE